LLAQFSVKCIATVVVALALAVPGSAERIRERADRSAADPVLWRDPGSIAQKDLFWGAGHAERAPRPPFTFVKEDTGGTKPKVIVADAHGTTWSVKFSGRSASDNEVHAEIAATRLAWAFGYLVEEHYYVADGVIDNAHGLRRAADSIGADGRFRVARFERRSTEMSRTGHWSLVDNPFADTQELSGLKLVLALVNNWDTKPGNLSVFRVMRPDGQMQDLYLVSDYGSSFGRMAPFALFSSRNRWSLPDYQSAPFIEGVTGKSLTVNHKGDVTISTVPIEHARWFARLASQLTDDQVRRAFEASGASREEIEGFSARVMEKLRELRVAVGAAA
jgi:hypothetical protein